MFNNFSIVHLPLFLWMDAEAKHLHKMILQKELRHTDII
jgi:hypothetical protein